MMPVTAQEARAFSVLRSADWLLADDVAARAELTVQEAEHWCHHFFHKGVVVRRSAYPCYRYRATKGAMQIQSRPYFEALCQAVLQPEPVR
jgi:hypothetical protein